MGVFFTGDMKVYHQGATQIKSKKTCNPHSVPQIRTFDNFRIFPDHHPFAGSADAFQDPQQPAQAEGVDHTQSRHGTEPQAVAILYTNGGAFPDSLSLKTVPMLRPSEKLLMDAIRKILRKMPHRSSGSILHPVAGSHTHSITETTPSERHTNSVTASLSPKAGGAKTNKVQARLSIRKRRSPSRFTASSRKRLKSSSTSPSDVAMNPAAIAHQTTKAVSTEQEPADFCDTDDSEGDERERVIFEEESQHFRADERDKIAEHYRKAMAHGGQTWMRNLMKAWIKIREPGKQTNFPYNGGPNRSDDPHNPGRNTAPDWWCCQEHWQVGLGCRHKEPDHLWKRGIPSRVESSEILMLMAEAERLFFSPKILRFTRSNHPRNVTVDRFKESTDQIDMSVEQRALLRDLYRVRAHEQAYEEGEMDGDAVIYVQKLKSHPGRCKKISVKASEGGKDEVKQECSSTPAAQTSASRTASVCSSSFHSTLSPITVKHENGHLHAEYTGLIQAPLPHYGATFGTGEIFDAGEAIGSDPAAELSSILAGNNQLPPNAGDFDRMMSNPFVEAPTGQNHYSMGGPSLYPSINNGLASQGPVRYNNDRSPPRPSSVQKQPSSSWCRWPAPSVEFSPWNFPDDTIVKLRQPKQSDGKPAEPPEVPLFGPNSHAHGLAPAQQLDLCVAHRCPVSHTHGWRTLEEQLRVCAAYRCKMDPRIQPMPGVFVDPRALVRGPQMQNPQLLETNLDDFHLAEAQTFDVTRSFS